MANQDARAGPSNPPSLTPISSQALYCLRRFETICDELRNLEQEIAIQNGYDRNLVLLTMQDSRAKFKAWGTSIAAFRQGHVRTSLDFRLRDAPEIRSRLLQVLEYLAEYINDASKIILGNGDMSSDSDTENEPEEDASSDALNPTQGTSYLEELCMAIRSSNGSLMKLSMLIRESSNRDDYLKAASRYRTWEPSPFISHVREKYGSAKGNNEWLVERLGKAIMRRRQFLTYREEHHGKLTGDWGEDLHEVVEEKGPDILKLAKTVASTRATTFIVDGNATKKEDVDLTGSFGSQTSYEATEFEGDGTVPTKLTVPPPPKWAFPDVPFEYGEPFQCPYCYTEQEVKNKAAWKKHIFRDLKPYVCTFAECALRMFRSRNEWFAHELQCHRREWVCQHCQHAAFASASAFSCHLEVTHPRVLQNSQFKALLLQSEEPVDKIRPNACPLCDGWELDLNNLNQDSKRLHLHGGNVVEPYGTLKQFRRHLGRHMEQLALFALPIKESDGLEDDSADETDGNDSESLDDAKRAVSNTAQETKLPPTTSETVVEKIEAIMLHFRTAMLPICTQFTQAPPGNRTQRGIEYEMLREKIINEVSARIYDINIESNSEAQRKKVSSIKEVRGVLMGLRRAVKMENDSISGSSSDGHYSSEEGESTRIPERQHSPISASGSQPYDFVTDKELDSSRRRSRSRSVSSSSSSSEFSQTSMVRTERSQFPKRGKTRMPARMVSKRVLIELGYVYEEEDTTIIIKKALGREHIDEILQLSDKYRTETKTDHGEVIVEETYAETIYTPPAPAPLENRIDSIETSQTPLPLAAAENGHEEVVTPLLEQKGKANSKDEDILTPLRDEGAPPPGARWTKISRSLVNPEALEGGQEKYEAEKDFVIVQRALTKEETQTYATATQRIRAEDEEGDARRRRRKERHERHSRERHQREDRDEGEDSDEGED